MQNTHYHSNQGVGTVGGFRSHQLADRRTTEVKVLMVHKVTLPASNVGLLAGCPDSPSIPVIGQPELRFEASEVQGRITWDQN